MNSEIKRGRPIIIAVIVILLSSLVGFRSYKAIHSESLRTVTLLSDIEVGEKLFSILHGEDCIGYLRSVYTEGDDLSTINLKSEISLLYDGNKISVPFSGSISLNALLQAGGSFFESKIGDTSFFIGTNGVHPIVFQVSIQLQGESRNFKFDLEGPINLRSTSSETFVLEMPALDKLQKLLVDAPIHSASSPLVTIGSMDRCAGVIKAMDITPFVSIFSSIKNAMPSGK